MSRTDPLRVLRYFDRISDAASDIAFKPVRGIIDPTNLCNYKCPWCEPLAYRQDTIKKANHTLKLETVKEVLEDLMWLGAGTVLFTGGGEPMLHPKFGEIARYAKTLGLKVAIDTNGSYISKWHNDILEVDNIRISLNAVNDEEYGIQTGDCGNLSAVCDAIKKLASEPKHPELGISYVVSDCNKASSESFEALTRDLGADFTYTRIERGETFGTRNFSRCYSSITIPVIGANGDVQACCDRRDVVFGNVYKTRLRNLWGSPEHQKVAKAIVPQFCQKCVHHYYNEAVEKFIIKDETHSWIV